MNEKTFAFAYLACFVILCLFIKIVDLQDDFDTLYYMVNNLEERLFIINQKEKIDG